MTYMFRLLVLMIWSLATGAAYSAFAQDPDDTVIDASSTARLEVRITQLEEQVRKQQGIIEQAMYQNTQLKAQLDKSNADMQYRLTALETKATAPVPAAAPATPDTSQLKPVEQPVSSDDIPGSDDGKGDKKPTAAPAASVQKFANARDEYNYAFKLLNKAKYVEAGAQFADFTQQYPKDELIGNAYYWLGETYYVRHDYVKSADNFRAGYQAKPTGPKAADNLLKLSMALSALNKDKDACVVLKQVITKFGSTSSSVKPRAEQEINRIGCN